MPMMCPFCLQENAAEALVCASCARDIAVPASLIAERDDLARKREAVRQELFEARTALGALKRSRKNQIILMECPFCAESVKTEAIVCKHCSRDLRVARPVMLEIQEIVTDLHRLQRELDGVNARLARIRFPLRYFVTHSIAYVLIPILLLVAAHIIVTIVLDVTPLYLRLASVVIPLPFGLLLYARHKIGWRGAALLGILTATLAVTCMLVVTGVNDKVPIIPGPWIDWREVIEYITSIALAFITGNILGFLVFDVLPQTMVHDGKPNAIAFMIASTLGRHVGEEQLRRRARRIQDLLRTAGPVMGLVMTAGGSVYAGLKGIFGW